MGKTWRKERYDVYDSEEGSKRNYVRQKKQQWIEEESEDEKTSYNAPEYKDEKRDYNK